MISDIFNVFLMKMVTNLIMSAKMSTLNKMATLEY